SEAWWRTADGNTARRPLLDITGARRAMFAATLRRLSDPGARICTSELAGRHTALIESIHRQASIATVPATQVDWSGANGATSQVPDIRGLAAALHRSYETEQSLAAGGFKLGA